MFLYVLLSVIHQSWSFRKLKRFIETGEEIVEVAFSFHNLKCEKLNNIYIYTYRIGLRRNKSFKR